MALTEPMHRNKRNITYLGLLYRIQIVNPWPQMMAASRNARTICGVVSSPLVMFIRQSRVPDIDMEVEERRSIMTLDILCYIHVI